MRTAREIAALFRAAGWPARLLFLALTAMFAFRAAFIGPSPAADRGSFMGIGAAVLDGGRLYDDRMRNTWPPPFAVAATPVEALRRVIGDRPVRYLWGAAQLTALVFFTMASARLLRLRLTLGALALAWLCSWRYILSDLNYQNVSLLLSALTVGGLLLADSDRVACGSALLAAGATLKVWPGAAAWPFLVAGWARTRRALLGLVAGFAASAALTAVVLGERFLPAARFWLREIAPRAGGSGVPNQTWRGLFLRLLVPHPPLWEGGLAPDVPEAARARLLSIAAGTPILLAVLALIALRPARSPRSRAFDALLAVFALMPALPIAWAHYYVTGLPVALAVIAGMGELSPGRRRGAVALYGAGTALAAFVDVDVVGKALWFPAAFYGNTLFGSLLVLSAGLVVREGWRAAEAATGDPGRRG